MATINVPLNRVFSLIAPNAEASEENEIAMSWGHTKTKCWSDLEAEYRVTILADAGAGKTFEMRNRAASVARQGNDLSFLQLAGDYLLEEAASFGIMLLIWQGCSNDKHWESISHLFPNVSAIKIIVIDLTLRAKNRTVDIIYSASILKLLAIHPA